MGIVEGLFSGLAQAVSPEILPYLLVGSVFGLIIGVIPGLSGHFAMAMLIPFLYGMDPATGIAFLLAGHSTVSQGGGLTAILFSTPGTGQNAATLMDGPPLTARGLGGWAVGAAMTCCFLGAAFGAFTMAALMPVLQRVVLLFGPPEIFMLAFLALTFVAVLGREDLTRGLIAGLLGLLLSMVGIDNVTNQARFTFGSLSLWDGLSLVPVILGLFAAAEMIDLWVRGGSLARQAARSLSGREMQRQLYEGILEAARHWWLVLRSSVIGTVIGLIPGLGSAPAAFVAYAHAKQTSKHPETFGHGNIEGVIAPESANDAVEGGALASTVAFGIPGSSSMAILLGGLIVLGIETGPRLVVDRVDLVFVMIWTIVLGNFLGFLLGLLLANPLARVTFLRSGVLVPVLLAVIVTGAFSVNRDWFDIGVVVAFGILGYIMKVLNYPRPALLIGFVLGFTVERNLYLALRLRGPTFFLEPLPLALGLIALAALAYNVALILRDGRRRQGKEAGDLAG